QDTPLSDCTESEGEIQFEDDDEEEEKDSHQIPAKSTVFGLREKSSWSENSQIVLIRKPTASNISHGLLNPFLHRNFKNV
ncbi:hypothetical protein HDV02_000182, partial [Globomyces sp. JEL0801]